MLFPYAMHVKLQANAQSSPVKSDSGNWCSCICRYLLTRQLLQKVTRRLYLYNGKIAALVRIRPLIKANLLKFSVRKLSQWMKKSIKMYQS